MKAFLTLSAGLLACLTASAQDNGWKFPWPATNIAHYTASRVTEPIQVDGKLDEPAWKAARASPRFVDLITGQAGDSRHPRAVVWDDQYLYVAYRVQEPFVHAKFTNHNDLDLQR